MTGRIPSLENSPKPVRGKEMYRAGMSRIAYSGSSGSFTEMALTKFESCSAFDGSVERVPVPSEGAALDLVRSDDVAGAVVPIESSVTGSIAATLDSLGADQPLQIMAENELEVTYTIAARSGICLSEIRTLAVDPDAAAQVRHWIAAKLPHADTRISDSVASAAEDAARGATDAAVTTRVAGGHAGLTAVVAGVADNDHPVTRFVLITRPQQVSARSGQDRTSVIFEPPPEPGALVRALLEFSTRRVDLTRLVSRPALTGLGDYRFHLDCAGHLDDPTVAQALIGLRRMAPIRFLGSWPAVAPPIGAAPPSAAAPPSDTADAAWLAALHKGVADPWPAS